MAALLPSVGASGGVMSFNAVGRLGAQRFPALGAACIDDLATSFGGHARTKTVATLAHEVRRLVGAFHRSVSIYIWLAPGFGVSAAIQARSVLGARDQVKPLET